MAKSREIKNTDKINNFNKINNILVIVTYFHYKSKINSIIINELFYFTFFYFFLAPFACTAYTYGK